LKILFYWQIFKVQLNVLKSFFYTSKSLKFKYAHFLLCNTNRCIYLPVDHLWNQQDTTDQVFYGPVYYLGVNKQTISENAEPGSASRLCSAFISVFCQLYCTHYHRTHGTIIRSNYIIHITQYHRTHSIIIGSDYIIHSIIEPMVPS
jgi:hypothetical protein